MWRERLFHIPEFPDGFFRLEEDDVLPEPLSVGGRWTHEIPMGYYKYKRVVGRRVVHQGKCNQYDKHFW
jgi:hypothetical protein